MTAAGVAEISPTTCRTTFASDLHIRGPVSEYAGRAEAGNRARYGPEEQKRADLSARGKQRRRPGRHVTL
jgi:hypothetical protein